MDQNIIDQTQSWDTEKNGHRALSTSPLEQPTVIAKWWLEMVS